jgi:hypothetical protein
MGVIETLAELRKRCPGQCWFKKGETAALISASVEDVAEYLLTGQMDSRWGAPKSGAAERFTHEFEIYRWLECGPRRTMDFVTAMELARSPKFVKRADWHHSIKYCGPWGDSELWEYQKFGLTQRNGYFIGEGEVQRRMGRYEATKDDQEAINWIEDDFFR